MTRTISSLSRWMLAAIMSVMIVSLVPPTIVGAVTAADWRADRIIDDEVFYNSNSMNVNQIQQFLNSKVPVCDTQGTKQSEYGGGTRAQYGSAHGNPPPYTCLKDYKENTDNQENNLEGRPVPAGAKSAAQIIWDSAQRYAINPQVLIAIIQREQALVLDEWPFPSPQFKSATGYMCPDSGPNNSIQCLGYFGFYNQVESAAWQLRRYATFPNNYNHVPGRNNSVRWSPQPSCGSSTVFIQNQATASLYNYAPYQPNQAALNNMNGTGDACSAYANRNFWRDFTNWFGSTYYSQQPTAFARHPDGTLVRTVGEAKVYLIISGVRYHIPDIETFNSYGYSWSEVRNATTGDRDLPVNSGTLAFRGGTLIKGDGAPQVFSLRCMPTFCMKDHISSFEVFQALGLKFSEVQVLPQSRVDAIVQDKTITSADVHLQDSLVLDAASGKVYLIDTASKRWVPSLQVFSANDYSWSKVRTASTGDLALPNGSNVDFPEGALVQASGQNAVYVVNRTDAGSLEKRHITSNTLFAGFGYNYSQVFVVDSSLLPAANGADLSE